MNTRYSRRLLFVAALAATPAAVRGQVPAGGTGALAAYTFEARATGARGVETEVLKGTAYVSPGAIRVVVREGQLRMSVSDAQRERVRPVGVAAVLAYGDTVGGWTLRRRSQAVLAAELPLRGDTLADSVVFVIPRTGGLDLRAHWLAFEFQSQIRVAGESQWRDGFWLADGRHDLFAGAPARTEK